MAGRIPSTEDVGREQIVERPDGTWWLWSDDGREVGPFASRADARAAIQAGDEESPYEPGETIEEARSEIGIADWIDPDTGEPAEEDGTRIEEH
jgi:hypothetical protein